MGEASNITEAVQANGYETQTNPRSTFDELLEQRAKSQAFFAKLADSARPGYVGDSHKTFIAQLLLQAESAGLYDPRAGT